MLGFIILILYVIVLSIIFIRLRKTSNLDTGSLSSLIYANWNVTPSMLTFSILSAWMWTTSIIGSTETFAIYGPWGPITYFVSACVAFALFVPLVSLIRRKTPGAVSYLEFIGQRYGINTKMVFYLFAFIISAYVLIEQAVGIAIIFNNFFGSPFKLVAFLSVAIIMAFVCLGGMKWLLAYERMTAVAIIVLFVAFMCYFFSHDFTEAISIDLNDYSNWSTKVIIIPAIKYLILATVIAFNQLAFDPAYYIKSRLIKDTKKMKTAFNTGGIVLWGSISLITTMCLGWIICVRDIDIFQYFSGTIGIVFSIGILIVGMSTIAHYLMGILGIFTVDFYKSFLRAKAPDTNLIAFGRVMTISAGVFCALVAIALEDISLLTIDVFCAIFFAAPCASLIIGAMSNIPISRSTPIISTVIGIIAGLILWIMLPSAGQWDQIIGMSASLILPALIILVDGFLLNRIPNRFSR